MPPTETETPPTSTPPAPMPTDAAAPPAPDAAAPAPTPAGPTPPITPVNPGSAATAKGKSKMMLYVVLGVVVLALVIYFLVK